MRYPGTLVVEFLDPLPPGLQRREFIARISTVIEDASNRLVEAARAEQAQLFGRDGRGQSANWRTKRWMPAYFAASHS